MDEIASLGEGAAGVVEEDAAVGEEDLGVGAGTAAGQKELTSCTMEE